MVVTGLPWKYSSAKARAMLSPVVERGEAVCLKCGHAVLPGQQWDVDHLVPRDLAPQLTHEPANWAIAHRRCNRAAGARYGNRKRARALESRRPKASRSW